ncbi:MAG: hypothetical protein NTW94_04980 [Legionellales bacterium]|nr:hypothetical protein [Legionellales bacterium]
MTYGPVITFVGSNRQSKEIDEVNGIVGNKGSCFPAIRRICDILETELDTFLLADIYGDLPDGTAFANATNPEYKGSHAKWLFDNHKGTILYAQMQRIANANPKEPIVFDFFDDRVDILESLERYFSKHPSLIPSHVTLRLHQYEGFEVKRHCSIQGHGFIDANYRETVKEMAAIEMGVRNINFLEVGRLGGLNTVHFAHLDLLTKRRPFTDLSQIANSAQAPTPSESPTDHLVVLPKIPKIVLDRFIRQLFLLEEKAEKLYQDGFRADSRKAFQLHDKLHLSSQDYLQGRITLIEFRDISDTALGKAHDVLGKHHGWKQFLGNLGLAIAGFGIGYVFLGLVNFTITGHFLLFRPKTKLAQNLDDLQVTIEHLAPL